MGLEPVLNARIVVDRAILGETIGVAALARSISASIASGSLIINQLVPLDIPYHGVLIQE